MLFVRGGCRWPVVVEPIRGARRSPTDHWLRTTDKSFKFPTGHAPIAAL